MAANKAEYLRVSLALQDLNELKNYLENLEKLSNTNFALHRLNRSLEYLKERKISVDPMSL